MDKDVLEIKIPTIVSIDVVNQYIDEINELAGINLIYAPF